jgi:hypothetical protein
MAHQVLDHVISDITPSADDKQADGRGRGGGMQVWSWADIVSVGDDSKVCARVWATPPQ